ncbi:MAG TPA: alpha/beta fold hydrolase [Candidatus Nanoarchaeia archaeon]|nr:alpha/beta fold hydrolase [Candidatus Nanoarchaeia archaeon]
MKLILIFFLTLLIFTSCETTSEKTKSGFIKQPGITGEPAQACTLEAKVCPDGSSVGRTGLNCEFEPCSSTTSLAPQTLVLETQDGAILTGTLYPSNEQKAIVLLHMLGKNRQSWQSFAHTLQETGYAVLAIDLRGHGESILQNNQRIHYESFDADRFNDMTYDVKAARDYFQNKIVYIVGASIGANLALKYAAQDPNVQKIVLLSPGLDYRGVNIEQEPYSGKILIVTSEDDAYSAESSKKLAENRNVKLQLYEAAGHGTSMLVAQPELAGFLVDWMNQ